MGLDQTKLEKLLQSEKSQAAVVRFFAEATSQERKELAPFCARWLKEQMKIHRQLWRKSYKQNPLLGPAAHAAYACCSFDQVKSVGIWDVHGPLAYQLLRDRQPDWLPRWLQQRADMGREWPTIHRICAEGLCDWPEPVDHVIRNMIDSKPPPDVFLKDKHLLDQFFWRIFEVPETIRLESPFGALHPEWQRLILVLVKKKAIDRQRVFDRCFSAVNMGFNRANVKFFFDLHDALKPSQSECIAMRDSYYGLLHHSFANVVQFGFDQLQKLDDRSALNTAELCEGLQVTLNEPTKKMGLAVVAWLKKLHQRDPQSSTSIGKVAVVALNHANKDVQMAAWKFLSANYPAPDTSLNPGMVEAQENACAAVRKHIRQWLAESASASPQQKASSTAKIPTQSSQPAGDLKQQIDAAKKVPKKLRDLGGLTDLLNEIRAGSDVIVPCQFDGTELKRLEYSEQLTPIESLEELVQIAAAVLEDGLRIDDYERVVDAMTRFSVKEDPDARVIIDPVVERAWKLLAQSYSYSFVGSGVHRELRALLVAWACPMDEMIQRAAKISRRDSKPPRNTKELMRWWDHSHLQRAGFPGFLGLRAKQICEAFCEDRRLRLLATATHQRGWVDPLQLVSRASSLQRDLINHTVELDRVLALLRLAPENRRTALRKAKGLPGEYGAAIRYALGAAGSPRAMKTPSLWVAAARARSPWQDDKRVQKKFPDLGVDTGRVAHYHANLDSRGEIYDYTDESVLPRPHNSYDARMNVDFTLPTAVVHEHDIHCDLHFGLDTKPIEQEIASVAHRVWPIALESYFRVDAFNDLAIALEPLFDPCVPMGEMSTAALVCSLGSGYPAQRIQAIDAAICVIEDGRYDHEIAGRILALCKNQCGRYAKSLPEVAGTSLLHAYQVAQTIIEMLWHEPQKLPSSFGALLEVLWEIMQQHSITVTLPEAREFLSAIPGTGKAAKLARKIVAFEPEQPLDRETLYCEAIRGRLDAPRSLI